MFARPWISVLGVVGLMALLTCGSGSRADEEVADDTNTAGEANPAEKTNPTGDSNPTDDTNTAGEEDDANSPPGVQVLARGPVHEAFAEPVAARPEPGPVVPRQPRAPIEEEPAEQKPEGDNTQWIPGYWAWDEERADFVWVSGIWRAGPPGRQWVPGQWNPVEGGWQWTPGLWTGEGTNAVHYVDKPPESVDNGPSRPADDPDNQVYVAGYWEPREERFVWRPGYWSAGRPGWVYVPAHYVCTLGGYVFVDGYWDYPLEERGLLFAPVAIDVAVCPLATFCYHPCCVVRSECLYGALFVRGGCGGYYFGDYFEARYRRCGYVAWCDVRFRWGYADPIFRYYRWSNRRDRIWEARLRGDYRGRFHGTLPRPPRTLVRHDVRGHTTVINRTTVNNHSMVTSLARVDRSRVRLQPVTASQRQTARSSVRQYRQASQERGRFETSSAVNRSRTGQTAGAPRALKVNLPRTPAHGTTAGVRTPPPAPPRAPVQQRFPSGVQQPAVRAQPQQRVVGPQTGQQQGHQRPQGQPWAQRPQVQPQRGMQQPQQRTFPQQVQQPRFQQPQRGFQQPQQRVFQRQMPAQRNQRQPQPQNRKPVFKKK